MSPLPLAGQHRQADQGRESRAAMRFGQAGDRLRPADPHRAAEHALHVIGDILEFRPAAGQHDLPPDRAGEAKLLQRMLDLAGDLLGPLADDGDQLGVGDPAAARRPSSPPIGVASTIS